MLEYCSARWSIPGTYTIVEILDFRFAETTTNCLTEDYAMMQKTYVMNNNSFTMITVKTVLRKTSITALVHIAMWIYFCFRKLIDTEALV
ncbi:MAG: hypothetical protein WDO19_23920 [Bacteroidota bacterium]